MSTLLVILLSPLILAAACVVIWAVAWIVMLPVTLTVALIEWRLRVVHAREP